MRRSESTTHTPYASGCDDMVSSGRRWIIPIATVIPPTSTPVKFINAARITDLRAVRAFVYMTGATALAVS